MHSGNPRRGVEKGTTTISCRLDKTIFELLQEDSKTRGISLNSLVNKIMKRYISWERYADQIGFIPLAKETVRLIFEALDEKKIQAIAKASGKTVPRDLIILMFNKIDFSSTISFMEITCARFGTVQHRVEGDTHELTIHHGVSKKFSNFMAEGTKAMAEELGFKITIKSADTNLVSMAIQEISSGA